MTNNGVIPMLNELAELRAQIDLLALDKQAAIEAVLAPLQAELDAIDAEYAPALELADEKASDLEKHIKDAVKQAGESVKGGRLHAVYSRRTSWDSKALTGYAAAHPEIDRFKRVSQSVSIRVVK